MQHLFPQLLNFTGSQLNEVIMELNECVLNRALCGHDVKRLLEIFIAKGSNFQSQDAIRGFGQKCDSETSLLHFLVPLKYILSL